MGRRAKIVVAVGAAAALGLAGGGSLVPAGAAVAGAAVTGAGADPLSAWAVTAAVQNLGGALTVNPVTHTIYVEGEVEGSLSVVNGLTGKVTGTITVPGQSLGNGAVDPATDTFYIAAKQAVVVINGRTNKLTTTIPVAGSPGQFAVDQATDTIYALDGSGTVTVIDGSTNAVTTSIDVGDVPSAIADDPVTNTIYVASFASGAGGGTVSVIDGATNTVTKAIDLPQIPVRMTVNPVTDLVYVADAGATTLVIDGASNTVTAEVDADGRSGIAADPLTDTIYTLDENGGLNGLDGRTNEFVVSLITAEGEDPGGTIGSQLAVDPAAGTIDAVDIFNSTDGPDTDALVITTSCRSHVVAPAGSNCAAVALGFEPTAVTFSSAADGVALGTTSCAGVPCFQAAMMATTDGGKHWSFLDPPPDLEVEPSGPPGDGLLFTSADNGWLFGIWRTRDAGASWQLTAPGESGLGGSVLAMGATATTAYAAVAPFSGHGELFATPIGSSAGWTKVPAITSAATGLAVWRNSVWVTSATHVWSSTDSRHWHRYPARCPGAGYRLAGVTATSASDVAFLCTRSAGNGQNVSKKLLLSVDGGRTVHVAGTAPPVGNPQGLASPPGDPSVITIVAGAKSGLRYWLYRSRNGGKSWATQVVRSDQGALFRSLTYTSASTGWVVLSHGGPDPDNMLLRTSDGGTTWQKATT